MALPTDPLFGDQWHLLNTGQTGGTSGADINVISVWDDYTGAGINIAIYDDGLERLHQDLFGNYDLSLQVSGDFFDPADPQGPTEDGESHGTAVAGIIAGSANNGTGGVGVAYGATIAGVAVLSESGNSGSLFQTYMHKANFHVVNHSYGFVGLFSDDVVGLGSNFFAEYEEDLLSLTINVVSAGNERDEGEDTNAHNFINSRFTIAVAAADHDGDITSYSTPGASLLVTAFGGYGSGNAIVTTGLDDSYVDNFNGTSSAAPMVTGVVALMLEANPDLDLYSIQELLAYSARETGGNGQFELYSYETNGATNWNGGGLTHSNDYGFGLVDAHAAVRLAETWALPLLTEAAEVEAEFEETNIGLAIPDDDSTGVSYDFEVTDSVETDYVYLTVDLDHTYLTDLQIVLISPSGTESMLLNRIGRYDGSGNFEGEGGLNFRFSSAAFWGEDSAGTWTLTIRDVAGQDTGTLNGVSFTAFGSTFSDDSQYVYTDSYGDLADPGRQTLSDAAGSDTLNAGALSLAAVIDLTPGSNSEIAGRILTIGVDTVIENAIGGDGADTITGNDQANNLYGMRGADLILSGAGNDNLYGGDGADILRGEGGNDVFYGGAGADQMFGGLGNDQFFVTENSDLVFENPDEGFDILYINIDYNPVENVERVEVWNTSNGLVIQGGDADNRVVGGVGDDEIVGIRGNDFLTGGFGDDYLHAGPGNDTIYGEQDNDLLYGGSGRDHFMFYDPSAAAGVDTIRDFEGGAGGDYLNLWQLFDAVGYAGDDPQADGYLRFMQSGTDTNMDFDANGGGDGYTTIAILRDTDVGDIVDENLLV